jgi:exopolyphosphatase/guanosine-5'-triphosphate,3'-diphosphate pyrophosphatase
VGNEMEEEMTASNKAIAAAIDVGTNAVRLKIGGLTPHGTFQTLFEDRDPVRSGQGVFRDGCIPAPVIEQLAATLARYAARCRQDGAVVRAVATSAARQAANGTELVAAVRRTAGLDLEIISGDEEARLVCLGALRGQPMNPGRRCLVIDVGAGSTELALASGEHILRSCSLPLGSFRLAEETRAGGARDEGMLVLAMQQRASAVLTRAWGPGLPYAGIDQVLGTSGTLRALVRFAAADEDRATARQIDAAVARLVAMGEVGRRQTFDPSRADTILPGAIILQAMNRALGLTAIEACNRGLRDGILLELFQPPSTHLHFEGRGSKAL